MPATEQQISNPRRKLIEDCVAGSGEEAHEASLKTMAYLQTAP